MTEETMKALGERLATTVKRYIDARLDALNTVGKRLAELEARPLGVRYRGTYQPGTPYAKDEAVTLSGSLWVCLRDTQSRPGVWGDDSANSWQLAVKAGRDGKDAR